MVEVTLQVHGRGLVNELAAGLSEIPGVRALSQAMCMRQTNSHRRAEHSSPGQPGWSCIQRR